MSDFWQRFEALKAQAAATVDGSAFIAAGFELYPNGGGSTAWRKDIGNGRFFLVTDSEGFSHDLDTADDTDAYLIGAHSDDGWHSENTMIAYTAAEAITACAAIVEIAALSSSN